MAKVMQKMQKNKNLVVFYSRTGITKEVADYISKILKCDIEEIKDYKKRQGIIGYMRSGREATLKIAPEIKGISKNLSKYDCIIIGTPIWAYTVCGPVRAFIKKYSKDIHKTAFFCTMGGSGDAKTLKDMEKLSGKKPVAVLSLKTTDVKKKSPESVKNIKLFTKSIKSL